MISYISHFLFVIFLHCAHFVTFCISIHSSWFSVFSCFSWFTLNTDRAFCLINSCHNTTLPTSHVTYTLVQFLTKVLESDWQVRPYVSLCFSYILAVKMAEWCKVSGLLISCCKVCSNPTGSVRSCFVVSLMMIWNSTIREKHIFFWSCL